MRKGNRSVAVTAMPSSLATALVTRRGLAALLLIGIAAAIAGGILYQSDLSSVGSRGSSAPTALSEKVQQGLKGIKTVADMLFGRSPGERAAGTLANLKHKRLAAPHERALPKIRKSVPPPSPLAAIVGAPEAPVPPVAAAPAAGTPLYNVVTAPPALAEAPPTGVGPAMPPPPSGGGLMVPPVVTQVPPTSPPPQSAVPEPATWAMMLIGLALVGRLTRRKSASLAAIA